MKTLIMTTTVAVALLCCNSLSAGIWTVNPGDSIQSAINSAVAGDTINVAAGSYTENIAIDKAVSVIGLGGWSSTQINGVANVGTGALLQGFRVGTETQGAFINGDNATIDSCWIESTGTSASTHTIQIYPDTATNNVTITNSTIKTNTYGKAAVYVDQKATILDGLLLDGNTVIGDYGLTQSFGALNTTITNNSFTGISGSTCRGIQIKTSMDNVLIENNDITGFAIGIRLDNNLAELGDGPVVVAGNTIWDNSSENMKIKRVPNLQVTGNEFSQSSDTAPNIHVYSGYSDLDVDFIQNNNILGEIGIVNDTTTTIDATSNWWGDVSGPAHSGNLGGIGASASDYVNYGNFLTQPIPEPGTFILLIIGGLTAIAAVWIRRGK